MNPTLCERHTANSVSLNSVISVSPIKILPEVGLSMPAIRFNRVVLPEPDGPMKARKSPSAILSEILRRTGISRLSRWYDLNKSTTSMSADSMRALQKLRSLYGNFRARFDPIIDLGDDLVSLFDAALDFNQATELLMCAHRHFNGAIISYLVDNRASGASSHCRFRDGEQ